MSSEIQEILRHLRLLYGDDAPGYLAIWARQDKRTRWVRASDLGQAARIAHDLAQRADVYYGVGLHREPLGPGRRGGRDTVCAVPGVWIDIDVAGPTHGGDHPLPPTMDDALAVVGAFGLAPTALVATGGGVHAYWLYREPWVLESREERQDAEALVSAVQATLRAIAAERGWHVDNTADLARVLRLPGTWNWKVHPPLPVRYIEVHEDRRYNPDDLWAVVREDVDAGRPPVGRAPRPDDATDEDVRAARQWVFDILARKVKIPDNPPSDSDEVPAHCPFHRDVHPSMSLNVRKRVWICFAGCGQGTFTDLAERLELPPPAWHRKSTTQRRGHSGDFAFVPQDLPDNIPEDLHDDEYWEALLASEPPPTHTDQTNDKPKKQNKRNTNNRNQKGQGRPRIQIINRHLRDIVAEAVHALSHWNQPPRIYLRGSKLVYLKDIDSTIQAEEVNLVRIRMYLDDAADFVKMDVQNEELLPARPPHDVCEQILEEPPQNAFPQLTGIRTIPVYLPGGRLLAKDGYDPDSGLYMRLRGLDGVRADMTLEEARKWLDELLADFPYVDEAGRAHTLALLLQPFVRPMIDGPTPLYLIDAPLRGTGKGLLAAVCCYVTTGERARIMTLIHRDPQEHEKRITATLLEGAQWILIDNVSVLDSAPLAAVLTARVWWGRLLGRSKMIAVPNDATWVATGNNVQMSDEIARRTIPIRLDPGVERPELRTGFRHDNLLSWVAQHRTQLVSACLSVVRAWVDAGCPEGSTTLGSYESWARVMGGILEVAGVPGFLRGREYLYGAADTDTEEWRAFVAAWWEAYQSLPVTAGNLLAIAKEHGLLLSLWAGRSHLGALQRLGRALSERRDRVYGGYRIRSAGRDRATGSAAYQLDPAAGAKPPQTPAPSGQNPRAETRMGQGFAGFAGVCGGFFDTPAPAQIHDMDVF